MSAQLIGLLPNRQLEQVSFSSVRFIVFIYFPANVTIKVSAEPSLLYGLRYLGVKQKTRHVKNSIF